MRLCLLWLSCVKRSGRTRWNYRLATRKLEWVIDHSPSGTIESVLSFCHYCLCDDKLADFLDYFESKEIGVINASPLSMGLLSERGVPAWHPAPKPLVEACRKAMEHCKAKNYPIEKLAMQFSVSNPRIATTLFSTTNPENVKRTSLSSKNLLTGNSFGKCRRLSESRNV